MALKNQKSYEPCELGFFERLNYYFGKLMTVRDFRTEQSYFNEKRWLLNRMTTGWGVVCGLEVKKCNDVQVKVSQGLALDQYGNEILVCQPTLVDIPSTQIQKTYFICIRYAECLSEPVPNSVEECGSMKTECEYNRIRETYEIKYIELGSTDYTEEIEKQCEHPYNPDRGPRVDCDEFLAHPCATILLKEDCPERAKGWLVLAKVVINMAIMEIDNCFCRRFVLSNDLLFQMASCLREELYGIRIDRRQFVPLLAYTLRGLKYRDGKIKMISTLAEDKEYQLNVGKNPFSITTDGDFIWFTDIHDQEQETYYVRKLSRDGKKMEQIKIDFPGWGIAFDGVYMWVTHVTPNQNAAIVTRIHAWDPTKIDKIDLKNDGAIIESDAREIVFDGKNMWISHENRLITQVNVSDPNLQIVHDWTKEITDTIIDTDLAFDGNSLWVGFETVNPKTEKITGQIIKITTDPIVLSQPLSISGMKGICFDGTHIWVGHDEGVSKIDIDRLYEIDIASAQKAITKVAFDGMQVWAIEPSERRVDRIEIFEVEVIGGVQTREKIQGEKLELLRMCFDGIFIWITAFLEIKGVKTGIIYRLLI